MFNQYINAEVVDKFARERGIHPEQAVFMPQHDQIDILMLHHVFNVSEAMNTDEGFDFDINTAGFHQAAQHLLCIDNFPRLAVLDE